MRGFMVFASMPDMLGEHVASDEADNEYKYDSQYLLVVLHMGKC
jgi:hypothetical protein